MEEEIFPEDMGKHMRSGWAAVALFLLMALAILFGIQGVSAAGKQPPGPDRFAVILQNYTSFEWWLTSYGDNRVDCSIVIDHDGLPAGGEIFDTCGQDIYNQWILTSPCTSKGECNGFYLQLVKAEPAQRKVAVKQQSPEVWVTLEGCVPYKSTFRCDTLPTLVLTGEEPMVGEHITGLEGNADGNPFTCDAVCQVDLVVTSDTGLNLEFWANSSYGDSSDIFQARVRVARSSDPADQSWYVDVLSTQWRGDPLAGCSQIWNKFPSVGGEPEWLTTPQRPEDLATSISYEYLAANLIKYGVADASSCSDGGFQANGLASVCGLEAARPAVNDWQNQFDNLIFSAAQQTGVPAPLLKRIFARESQFWPGHADDHPEAGFGQMTDGGADTVFTWNPSFYEQFCSSVLDQAVCKTKIYPLPEAGWEGIGLAEAERTVLRNALVNSVDAICPECSMGIDMAKADSSVAVFAQTMVASCMQAGKVLDMNYHSAPNEAATFEDLWRFTLVDYNAGPGCLGLAVDQTNTTGEPLDWEHLSSHLTPACQGALNYVNEISRSSP
jgi:hypothetical protein